MVSTSDYYTDLCKRKPDVARRARRFAHVLESTECLFKQQLDFCWDSLLTWPLGNVQSSLVIAHCYIEMVTKPYSELTHLIERQMHQVHELEHELVKEDKEYGEAGAKKYEAPEAPPKAGKAA